MRLISSTFLLSTVLTFAPQVLGDATSTASAEAPQLSTLVTRANTLLSSGQFADAARTYTEALELAPNDYLLYFKRATAYLSSSRHSPALDDFDTVLRLTDGSFDKALMAKAKILAKEGRWAESREALAAFSKKVPGDKGAQDLVSNFGIYMANGSSTYPPCSLVVKLC